MAMSEDFQLEPSSDDDEFEQVLSKEDKQELDKSTVQE